MEKNKAIQLLERLQNPEPYEPMLTKDAYDALQMAIDALENQKSVCEEYCEYEDCEAEKIVVQSLSSLYPLKEFEEIAIDKVLDAVKRPKRIRGRWIEITSSNHTYKCSVCGRLLVNITDGKNNVAKNYPYCHCGADMRGGQNERTNQGYGNTIILR